ncbi:MAG: T9SS type A sorting domain-containing protein [Bacteroidetes bacterium]|nr:T9SS type A sorting domain-containing protein [Bacteroidota bacterium]
MLSTTEVDGINYQWSMDGDPIPGADSTSLVVFASGEYALSATGVGGCFAESIATAVAVYEQPTPPSIIVIGNTLNTTSTWDVQWYYNGSPIPDATSTTYTPAVEGLYQVAAINGPCVAYSVEINFIFQSLDELLIDKITISPNPNNGAFSATFNVLKNQNISIALQNILGSTIYQKNYENVSGSMQENILLQGVNSGVYFLQIKGETGSIIEKIIIQ